MWFYLIMLYLYIKECIIFWNNEYDLGVDEDYITKEK